VILVDANLLVYAHVSSTEQHARARAWLDARLSGNAPVGLSWPTLLAFLRLVTNPRVFAHPAPVEAAWRQAGRWLTSPVVWIPAGDRPRIDPVFNGWRFRPVPRTRLAKSPRTITARARPEPRGSPQSPPPARATIPKRPAWTGR